jgi:DNA-binding XRE family transcriptional regulator
MASHYRRFSGQAICPAPLPAVPRDYPQHLLRLRRQLQLTQTGLARRIGAAGKAVIYQWESRKRTPSPVLWQRVLQLEPGRSAPGGTGFSGRTIVTPDEEAWFARTKRRNGGQLELSPLADLGNVQ